MVVLAQIELLLLHCTKVSFGIDADDEVQGKAFRIVKNKLNWLIAVKSYDKLLLDPTRWRAAAAARGGGGGAPAAGQIHESKGECKYSLCFASCLFIGKIIEKV